MGFSYHQLAYNVAIVTCIEIDDLLKRLWFPRIQQKSLQARWKKNSTQISFHQGWWDIDEHWEWLTYIYIYRLSLYLYIYIYVCIISYIHDYKYIIWNRILAFLLGLIYMGLTTKIHIEKNLRKETMRTWGNTLGFKHSKNLYFPSWLPM